MLDDDQSPPVPPGFLRVLELGADIDASLRQPVVTAPGGRAIVWNTLPSPDSDPAQFADLATKAEVVLVSFQRDRDAAVSQQRWVWLASQFAIPHLVIAVGQHDVPPEGRKGFDLVTEPLTSFIKQRCSFKSILVIPVAQGGRGNIAERSAQFGWYMGPALIDHLHHVAKPSTGDVGSSNGAERFVSDHVQARLLWLADKPLIPWRPFAIKTPTGAGEAKVTTIKYERDAHAEDRIARNRLRQGDFGVCNVTMETPMEFVSFDDDRDAGVFSLCDLETGAEMARGLVDYSLRRASNVRWQQTTITPTERARQKQQFAAVLWFTGLSGAGKSTLADIVEKRLNGEGRHTMLLDGDNVRHGLNKDLGFTDFDRVENIRRISEVAKLMCDAGLIVLVSFISPFRAERQLARETVGGHGFYEIYVATPLEVAEKRDVKGLYAKARRGEIKNFTGIDSPYEAPENPDITIDTSVEAAEAAADRIVAQVLSAIKE